MEIYRNRKKGVSGFVIFLLVIATALISGGGVYYWQYSKQDSEIKSSNGGAASNTARSERQTVQNISDDILYDLKTMDMGKLAGYVHPQKGVRFSPYSNVNLQKDVVIKASDLTKYEKDTGKRLWGTFDGSGDPIELTFKDYYKKFIYDVDFLEAPQIVYNQAIQRGNSILNVKEAYPDSSFIEYHYPGFDQQYNGMDWRSLILVFEKMNGKWYLIGIVHGQWTI